MPALVYDHGARALRCGDIEVPLTRMQSEFCLAMTERPSVVHEYDYLLDRIDRPLSDLDTLRCTAKNIRRKLVKAGIDHDPIRSRYGLGYVWQAKTGD